MSEIAYRPAGAVQVIRLPGGRATVTGAPARVAVALDVLRHEGRLLAATDPQPTGDGGVLVTVRLRPIADPRPAPAPPPRRWTPRRLAVVGVLAAGMLAAVSFAAFVVFTWLAAHWLPIAVVAGVLMLAAGPLAPRAVRVIVSVTVR